MKRLAFSAEDFPDDIICYLLTFVSSDWTEQYASNHSMFNRLSIFEKGLSEKETVKKESTKTANIIVYFSLFYFFFKILFFTIFYCFL